MSLVYLLLIKSRKNFTCMQTGNSVAVSSYLFETSGMYIVYDTKVSIRSYCDVLYTKQSSADKRGIATVSLYCLPQARDSDCGICPSHNCPAEDRLKPKRNKMQRRQDGLLCMSSQQKTGCVNRDLWQCASRGISDFQCGKTWRMCRNLGILYLVCKGTKG
jgi:hypothetical protein